MADEPTAPKVTAKNAALAKLLQRDPVKESSYYEALGRFIAAYAHAEAEIHTLARFYSGIDDERARIVFGGLRLTDSIDRLRALMQVISRPLTLLIGTFPAQLDAETAKIIEACLVQFQIIGQRRDKLIHRIISFADAVFNVSNAATAKSLSAAEFRLLITHQNLKEMKTDCQMVFLILGDLMSKADEPKWGSAGMPSWLYKPPPPNPPKPERPLGRRGRKRQRRASQGK